MKQTIRTVFQSGCFLAALLFSFPSPAAPPAPRERTSFNADWRFIRGDSPDAGDSLSYTNIKAWINAGGEEFTTNAAARPEGSFPVANIAYTQNAFDDAAWRKLNLPHDWGIEGPFAQENPGDTGKLPWWGVAWYRKHFTLPVSDARKRIYLDVDGAMAYATVWLNGTFIGGWPYGYASWQLDLTPYLKFGGDNVLSIRLDNPPNSSRWYPGGGIYRNVWLEKTPLIHVAHWGTYVTTPEASATNAAVKVQVDVLNDSPMPANLTVVNNFRELKPDGAPGKLIGLTEVTGVEIAPGKHRTKHSSFAFPHPRLWSVEHPNRYVVVTRLYQDNKMVDEFQTPFGVRSIEFTVTNGFLLNGRRVPLNGVCDHHDLGALGAAINERALARQLEILRSMGCNAIRTSHNPPAPELLDLCDRMGFLVMDESFDCWEAKKTANDYHLLFDDWHEKDWRAELRRDRNHPSIILWSIGNEVGEQKKVIKHWIAAELTAIAHQEDPTRPTTCACSDVEAGYNGFQKDVDVFGYNYKPWEYGKFRAANPGQPLFGSETASCISSRGEYFFPVSTNEADCEANFQMTSYDIFAPHWATTPDREFKGEDEFPFVAGEFVWTGFDYLGEPTPYGRDLKKMINFTDPAQKARIEKELHVTGKIATPSRSSYFGIIDLAGFPKDRYYLYQALWKPSLPMAHILPHWNWPDRVGQVTPVHVYTSGDEAELFLNGKSLGKKAKGQFEYRIVWNDVVYEPGELKVVVYKNGKVWATDVMKTTGPAAKLAMLPDRPKIRAWGNDLSFITVKVEDKDGWLVPQSMNHIKFEVSGPGEIVATDNGDATSFEPFQAPEHNAYNGMALMIVRATKPGSITVTAHADGLADATVKIHAK